MTSPYRVPDIGAAPLFSGTVVIADESLVLGSARLLDFQGGGIETWVSGSYAGVIVDPQRTFALNFIVGSGQSELPTGSVGAVELGVSGTVDYVRVYGDQTGTMEGVLRIGPWSILPFSDAYNRFGFSIENLRKQEFADAGQWSGSSFGRGDWLEVIVPTGTYYQVTVALGGRVD